MHSVQAALIEVSVMGAAIIAPEKWELTPGNRTEVTWEDFTGLVVVRRCAPYARKEGLYIYGVEYCDGRSLLGPALYDNLVVIPGAAQPPLPEDPGEPGADPDLEVEPTPPLEPLTWRS